MKCRTLPEIQRRGRWLAEGTARRYEALRGERQAPAGVGALPSRPAGQGPRGSRLDPESGELAVPRQRQGSGTPCYVLDLYAGTAGISQALARRGIDGSAWDTLFSEKADLADPQK